MDPITPGDVEGQSPRPINDGLDDLNVDIEPVTETSQILSGLARSGMRFDDGGLETLTMKRLDIEDRSILYTQRYEPRCHFCQHPLRDEAEAVWLESGKNISAIQRFFQEHGGGPRSWDSINNHIQNHCEWNLADAVNFLMRIRGREPELSEIATDDIGFSVKALNSLILDVGRFTMTSDPKQMRDVADAISRLMKTKKDFIQLQSELYGAHAQAEARMKAQTQKVMDFLRNLLSTVTDQQQKTEILRLMDEFRRDSLGRG